MRLILWVFGLLLFAAVFNQHLVHAAEADEDIATDEEEATHTDSTAPSDAPPTSEDIEEDLEEEEITLVASPDVHTRVLFPDYPTKKIPVGKDVTVLVGFSNAGSKPFNITYIGAHLHSPYDYGYYIQNFTVREVEGSVEPGSQISLEYSFKPDLSLEPLEFHLSGWVIYNDSEANMFRSLFVNGTIELTEAQSDFDVRSVFTWFLLLAALGLVAYVGFNTFATPGQKKTMKRATSSIERATKPAVATVTAEERSNDFLGGALYTPAKSATIVSRKGRKPRSNKSDKDGAEPEN